MTNYRCSFKEPLEVNEDIDAPNREEAKKIFLQMLDELGFTYYLTVNDVKTESEG